MADDEQRRRLEKDIRQANDNEALEQARQQYICMLENDDWRVTNRALRDALLILRIMGVPFPTESAVVDTILAMLKAGHPMKAIGMGEPRGSRGIAHVLKGGFLDDLYIKIKLEDDLAYVLSFHT